MDTTNTIQALQEYGDLVREQMVENLMNNRSFHSGDLARSIVNTVHANSLTAVIEVNAWYGITVEEGIGRKSGKMPPIAPIKNWIKQSGLRPKAGATVEQFAFAIARNIGKYGTNPKPRPFAAPAVQSVKEQRGDLLIENAMGKDIKEDLDVAFKQSAQ
tara:strand:+ start:1458 stop:1934 length:477 start_codon:yes stop_codon:yes gene_type:complete